MCNMQFKNTQPGYSLVEALVAIAILLLAIVGPMTIASKGLQSAQFAKEQNRALFLAQEGVEMVIYARNSDEGGLQRIKDYIDGQSSSAWDWYDNGAYADCVPNTANDYSSGGCGLHFTTHNAFSIKDCDDSTNACKIYFSEAPNSRNKYSHSSGGEETPFVRRVFVEQVAAGESVKVRSVVTWQSQVFGSITRPVVVETYLYNIYDY